MSHPTITVVGCGIAGLSCALRLQNAGFCVTIVSAELPADTTSAIAAAIWFPYLIQPAERADRWAHDSYLVYRDMRTQPATGIDMVQLHQVNREPLELPPWLDTRYPHQLLSRGAFPAGFDFGFKVEVPRIDTSLFLPYLLNTFLDRGGQLAKQQLTSLEEVGQDKELIINCSGLGARDLVADRELYPVRGQVLRIPYNDAIKHMAWDPDPNTVIYAIPRRHDCILGGSADHHNWDTRPDGNQRQTILDTCARILLELKSTPVLDTLVGLRPGRSSVRLESDRDRRHRWVIHNYGHGGAGFTVAWGCAQDVTRLALSLSRKTP